MKNIFQKKCTCIPQYNKANISISTGYIEIENDYDISYDITTSAGSSGSPIISTKLKVIGYHIGYNSLKKKNYGSLLKLPIQEFISYYS